MATKKRRPTTSRSYSERKVVHRPVSRESCENVGEEKQQDNGETAETKADYAQILEGIYGLSESELETVVSAANYALKQKQNQQSSKYDQIEIKPFYDALIQVIKELGTTFNRPDSYHVFISRLNTKRINEIAKTKIHIDDWIHKHVGKLKRTEQFAFYRFAWICLLNWLNKHNESRGPKTALRYADRIPEAIDDQLPGYVQSGVLKHIIRRHTEERKSKTGGSE